MKTKKPKLKFEVVTGPFKNDHFWWRCWHRNGNILFSSETFTRKASAMKSMLNFIAAVVEKDYEVK